MNKTAIKNFAVWARRKLISDITYKAGMLGITETGIAQPMAQSTKDLQFFDIGTKDYIEISGEEIKQRNALLATIRAKEKGSDYKSAFRTVIEEVAYTWFNRLIAVRFMEVNDYLPSRIRVLSSESEGKLEPDFVTTPFDTDLVFTPYEKDVVLQLKEENKLDELFRMLFIKQCNKLSEILPELFEQISDYTELLLNISFTDKDGVIYHLTHDINEDDFNVEKEGQVEIIGWMYQYYISERHNEVVNINKSNIKKDDIPAATQLFTPDWVVRYMVDNSLGRYWIERHPESNLADNLQFFVTPKNGQINYVNENVDPTELTFFDPCMGSGHILVYAFDVLLAIYRESGYTDRDAAKSIIENNLFGVDIDKRAYQLSYFAVLMKARRFNRSILKQNIRLNLAEIKESNDVTVYGFENSENKKLYSVGDYLINTFRNAKEIGSLQTVNENDYGTFDVYINNEDNGESSLNMIDSAIISSALPFVKQAKILSKKYCVVCTNPPYMNKFEGNLKTFLNSNFKDYSGDLFSAFIYRNFDFCKSDGYSAFMTPFVWMFIKTYEDLRNYILKNKSVTSLIQMEYSAFEEATVPICSFVLKNGVESSKGLYFRLYDFKGGMEVQKQKVLEAIANKNCGYFYEATEENFSKIPGCPIAYWVSENFVRAFEETMEGKTYPRMGLTTGQNDKYIRLWEEVSVSDIGFGCTRQTAKESKRKWFPYNKGGLYRKWYGNQDYIVNWYDDGYEMQNTLHPDGNRIWAHNFNLEWNFKEHICWNDITSGNVSFRLFPEGFLFDSSAAVTFVPDENKKYLLGLFNTKFVNEISKLLNPTLHFKLGDYENLPYKIERKNSVEEIVKNNIDISKSDWDSFETSWDFRKHPIVPTSKEKQEQEKSQFASSRMDKFGRIAWHFDGWKRECNERFARLKANEEELNRIFIDIYGLQDELTPKVEDKDVTVHYIADKVEDAPESLRKSNYLRTKEDEVKSLISYAVGCMFGRYSLDAEGLCYAGGEWDGSKYKTFIPDEDNCIPITDEEYFGDDIVGRFTEFIKAAYGTETLEENLAFIAEALGNKGKTNKETIRQYFLNDFYKDHCSTYSVTGSGKRPIYWLFDSGKENGFKALVYMHRWNADTVGNLRVEYLHKMQNVYEKEIDGCQDTIDNSMNNKEIATATKRKEKLVKQQKECKDYDSLIAHIALSRIDIDLDDGVKVNYRKVQTGADGKFCEILADSKDIMIKEDSEIWQNLISSK